MAYDVGVMTLLCYFYYTILLADINCTCNRSRNIKFASMRLKCNLNPLTEPSVSILSPANSPFKSGNMSVMADILSLKNLHIDGVWMEIVKKSLEFELSYYLKYQIAY